MNWTAFHFFKQPDGLSKNDALEMLICLDYERALECSKLVELVCILTANQREYMLSQALRFRTGRFVPLDCGPAPPVELKGLRSPPFRSFETMSSFPGIPAACVAASRFPKHWLCLPRSERRKIVEQVKPLYSGRSLPVLE